MQKSKVKPGLTLGFKNISECKQNQELILKLLSDLNSYDKASTMCIFFAMALCLSTAF